MGQVLFFGGSLAVGAGCAFLAGNVGAGFLAFGILMLLGAMAVYLEPLRD